MSFNHVLILASLLGFAVSFWNRNDLPNDIDAVPALAEEPLQTPTDRKAFDVTYSGVDYHVVPRFAYDITGLIVSYRHHDGNSRMHLRANDHLNMLDVCVIWGRNPANPRLKKISFWNGIFTCNVKTRDSEAWDAFDMAQLSNNHLISDDEFIRDQVKTIHVGDQIHVRGYLAEYTSPGGTRGTSTTRTDTGDGACEVIYVEEFGILRPAPGYWRIAMWVFLALLIAGLALHFRRPYKPY